MSLIKCTECGKKFSNKAKKCPNCFCPLTTIKEELYKESEKKLKECNDWINLPELKKIENIFESLDDYKDSKKKVSIIREKIERFNKERIIIKKKTAPMKFIIILSALIFVGIVATIIHIININNPYYIVSGYYTIPGSQSSSLLSSVSLEESFGKHAIRIVHWYTKNSKNQRDNCTKTPSGDGINCASESISTYYTATKNDAGDITIIFEYGGKNYTCNFEIVKENTEHFKKGTKFLNCDNNIFNWTKIWTEEHKTVINYK
jgi:hypothetical protein